MCCSRSPVRVGAVWESIRALEYAVSEEILLFQSRFPFKKNINSPQGCILSCILHASLDDQRHGFFYFPLYWPHLGTRFPCSQEETYVLSVLLTVFMYQCSQSLFETRWQTGVTGIQVPLESRSSDGVSRAGLLYD
jgi:hypothetical protein